MARYKFYIVLYCIDKQTDRPPATLNASSYGLDRWT